MNECRFIYTKGHRWSETQLSGVGFGNNMGNLVETVPEDPSLRYDDPEHVESQDVEVYHMLVGWPEDNNLVPLQLQDPTEPRLEDRNWGFAFHDSCWCLLKMVCFPQEVEVRQ